MIAAHTRCVPALRWGRGATIALTTMLLIGTVLPAVARAHGPVAPVATGYLARVTSVPAGVRAKVVDGYVRMWLHVPATATLVVLDYRGVPYLRFSPSGVQVNEHSEMFYLNQTPVAAVPPSDLTAATPPAWSTVGGGHAYEWHDGRLQALAAVALGPGTRYVGRWRIPVLVDGRPAAITGGLWHAPRPSLVWFWPIAVVLLCVLAGWRLRDARLDAWMGRGLAGAALLGAAVAGIGRGLHGRPSIPPLNFVELAALAVFVAWGAYRVLVRPPGWFGYFAIAGVAIWEGINLVPTLLNAFVLISLPAALARAAAVACLAAGVALLPPVFRLADAGRDERSAAHRERPVDESALDEVLGG